MAKGQKKEIRERGNRVEFDASTSQTKNTKNIKKVEDGKVNRKPKKFMTSNNELLALAESVINKEETKKGIVVEKQKQKEQYLQAKEKKKDDKLNTKKMKLEKMKAKIKKKEGKN